MKKIYKYFTITGTIIVFILAVLGTSFFIMNFETGTWVSHLPKAIFWFYFLVVLTAWIMALSLVADSFYASAAFMEISKYDFTYNPLHSDKKLGFSDILREFISHLSIVLYYIVGAIVVVYSEISKASIMKVTAKHMDFVILGMLIIMILYTAVNLIPLIQYKKILRQKAEEALSKDSTLQFDLRLFNKENILTFLSTAIIPIITLLLQQLTNFVS